MEIKYEHKIVNSQMLHKDSKQQLKKNQLFANFFTNVQMFFTDVLESLFNEKNVCNFIENRLQQRYFPANIAKFVRTALSREHLWWLLLQFNEQLYHFTGSK